MAMMPRSLCAGDGTLLLTADKANLIKALEDVKAQSLHDIQQDFIEEDLNQNDSIEEADATIKVLIIDAIWLCFMHGKEEHYANTVRSSGCI